MLLPFPARVRPVLAVPASPLALGRTRGLVPGVLDQDLGLWIVFQLCHCPVEWIWKSCFTFLCRCHRPLRIALMGGKHDSKGLLCKHMQRPLQWGYAHVLQLWRCLRCQQCDTALIWENIYGGFTILCAAAGVFRYLDLFSALGRLEYDTVQPGFGVRRRLWGMSIMSKMTMETCGPGQETLSCDSQGSLTFFWLFSAFPSV